MKETALDTITDKGLDRLLQALYRPTLAQQIASQILMSSSPQLDDQELAQDLRLRYVIWEAMHMQEPELCGEVKNELGIADR